MGKYLKTKPNSLESAVLEAVSPAQQAAIAIAKKEKEEMDEKANFSDKEVKMAIGIASDKRYKGGNMTGAVNAIEKIKKGLSNHPQVAAVLKRQNEDKEVDEGSKEEYEKFFKAALKKFGVDSPADFKSDEEKKKFFDYIDKNYEGEGEKSEQVNEKVEYVEYKFKNRRDAEQAHQYFRGIQLMDLDINDDGISDGELAIDAGKKDMTKYHKEVMKKFKPQVMTQEKLDEVMATWKVTVVKPVNKLKKGDSVSVKANNIPQALKKSAKAFGDSNLVAVPSTHFDVQKEETLVKKEVEVKESTNPYVDAAAKHISTMWKEAAKVKKEEDEPKKKEDSKTTMTGKPMSGVQVNPLGKE